MKYQNIVFYMVWILFFIVSGLSLVNNYLYGSFMINFNLFIEIVMAYPIQTILIILILSLTIYFQYKIYKEKLNSRRNCQIQFVELERIAQSWLEGEELEENIEAKLKDLMEVSFDDTKKEATNIISILVGSGKIQDLTFYQKYVFPYLECFSTKELEIISALYELLENKAKNLPSVATIFKDDNDKKNYAKKITNDKTSYQILSELSLFEHTMNVVENMFNILYKEKDSFTFVWSKNLIIAMGHDIGKIDNIENIESVKNIDKLIYNQNTHEVMSKFILSNAFPDYEYIDDVCEVIEKHHIQNPDKEAKNYKNIVLLNNADIFARQNEIKAYQQMKKEEKQPSNNEENGESDTKEEKSNNIQKIENTNIIVEKIDEVPMDEITVCYTGINLSNIIQKCIQNINKVETLSASGKIKLISITDNSLLYIPIEIFYKYIREEKIDTKILKNLTEVIDRFKKDGVYKYTKSYKLNNFVNNAYFQQKEYVVLDLNFLGVTIEEADLIKRNEPYLRNTSIEQS